jgi:hypothetical protein
MTHRSGVERPLVATGKRPDRNNPRPATFREIVRVYFIRRRLPQISRNGKEYPNGYSKNDDAARVRPLAGLCRQGERPMRYMDLNRKRRYQIFLLAGQRV